KLALESRQTRFGILRQALTIRTLSLRGQSHDGPRIVEELRAADGGPFDDDVLGEEGGEGAARLLDHVPGTAVLILQHRIAIDGLPQRPFGFLLLGETAAVTQPVKLPGVGLRAVLELEDLVLHLTTLVNAAIGVSHHRGVASIEARPRERNPGVTQVLEVRDRVEPL